MGLFFLSIPIPPDEVGKDVTKRVVRYEHAWQRHVEESSHEIFRTVASVVR